MRNWRCWFGHAMFDVKYGFPMPHLAVMYQPHTFRCRRCGHQETHYPGGCNDA